VAPVISWARRLTVVAVVGGVLAWWRNRMISLNERQAGADNH
jgi:hypothetical protein